MKLKHNDGYVLPMVLIVMTIVFTLGMIWLKSVRNSTAMSKRYLAHETAVTLTDSASAICRGSLAEDADYSGTGGYVKMSGGKYKIAVGEEKNADDATEEIKETEETKEMITTRDVTITAVCGEAIITREGTARFNNGTFEGLTILPVTN